jgi:hypothetical protein
MRRAHHLPLINHSPADLVSSAHPSVCLSLCSRRVLSCLVSSPSLYLFTILLFLLTPTLSLSLGLFHIDTPFNPALKRFSRNASPPTNDPLGTSTTSARSRCCSTPPQTTHRKPLHHRQTCCETRGCWPSLPSLRCRRPSTLTASRSTYTTASRGESPPMTMAGARYRH